MNEHVLRLNCQQVALVLAGLQMIDRWLDAGAIAIPDLAAQVEDARKTVLAQAVHLEKHARQQLQVVKEQPK